MSVEGWPTNAAYASTGAVEIEPSPADAWRMAELAIATNSPSAPMARALLRHRLAPEQVAALVAFASSSHAATYHPFTVAAIRAVLAGQEMP